MAQPTTSHPTAPPMGTAPPVAHDTPLGPEPKLMDDVEPMYLARLYPEAVRGGMAEARAEAMKAGAHDREYGAKVLASRDEELAAPPTTPPHDPIPPRREA